MKQKNKQKTLKQGFTLLELLVVVLIIGILASIALPQYQMAVTKAKVATILPLMRRWKDAMYEYKLQHGSYFTEDDEYPDAEDFGVSWPSDWKYDSDSCDNSSVTCHNDYWDCFANDGGTGSVNCSHDVDFYIYFYQPDDPDCEVCRDKIMCHAEGEEGNKICKALGGKLVEDEGLGWEYNNIL